ncbi:hypothetical protein SAMN04489712_11143 [Thermomonospora echinospora]|uniref:Uncharacterized protein n=1 Tax=Thermomonospora echinospora TaxID=1992 RepID=A0A1H6CR37_9ACTN|nr:hypothetical protein [Thermomonospora echinospora]SEG75472.1 hypothetical protein SAMN04489712_11143 [Thermomonospora echinospora]
MGRSRISVNVDLPGRDPNASVTLPLDERANCRAFCVTHPEGAEPVLAISHGGVNVMLTPDKPGRVTAGDVAVARALLEAVTSYVTDVERLHDQNARSSGSPGAGRSAV